MRSIGLPATLREATGHGADQALLEDLAQHAMTWGDMPVGGYGIFTLKDAADVFGKAFE